MVIFKYGKIYEYVGKPNEDDSTRGRERYFKAV
jgi:hypothetical protein